MVPTCHTKILYQLISIIDMYLTSIKKYEHRHPLFTRLESKQNIFQSMLCKVLKFKLSRFIL